MKILRVIVDELPECCLYCDYFLQALTNTAGKCILSEGYTKNYKAGERLPNCPLALEHDNKKIANEVM